jgi:hypothetical protein
VTGLLQLRTPMHDPPGDRRVIDRHAAFLHERCDMACAQGLRHTPANAPEHEILGDIGPMEAHRHHCSPARFTVEHRERP